MLRALWQKSRLAVVVVAVLVVLAAGAVISSRTGSDHGQAERLAGQLSRVTIPAGTSSGSVSTVVPSCKGDSPSGLLTASRSVKTSDPSATSEQMRDSLASEGWHLLPSGSFQEPGIHLEQSSKAPTQTIHLVPRADQGDVLVELRELYQGC